LPTEAGGLGLRHRVDELSLDAVPWLPRLDQVALDRQELDALSGLGVVPFHDPRCPVAAPQLVEALR
jgi:hypothetical protein